MSYLKHFNLNAPPFSLTPDPASVYWSEQHARAKAFMESTILLSDGFVVITGEVGSGKTTLLKTFLNEMSDDVICAVISQTQLTPTQFLRAVLTEFGFKPFDKKKVELLDTLNTFLIEQYSAGKKIILIVDEAQNLDVNVLEEIRMLSGIETAREKVLRIILAGQPELRKTLKKPALRQLMQRVRLKFHLAALNKTEMRAYVEHRLRAAGRDDPSLFDDDCFAIIYEHSGGIPRLINTICDTSLLVAFSDGNDTVSAEAVETAVTELDLFYDNDSTGPHRTLVNVDNLRPSGELVTGIEVRFKGETVSDYYFESGCAVLGRTADNDIQIDNKFISRHHLRLTSNADGCVLEDLDSTNGTYMLGHQVTKVALKHGDIISVGVHELVYHDLRDDDQPQFEDLPDLDNLHEMPTDDSAEDGGGEG